MDDNPVDTAIPVIRCRAFRPVGRRVHVTLPSELPPDLHLCPGDVAAPVRALPTLALTLEIGVLLEAPMRASWS